MCVYIYIYVQHSCTENPKVEYSMGAGFYKPAEKHRAPQSRGLSIKKAPMPHSAPNASLGVTVYSRSQKVGTWF